MLIKTGNQSGREMESVLVFFNILPLEVWNMFHKWGGFGEGEDFKGCVFWKLGQVDIAQCSETVCRDSGGRRTQVQILSLARRTGPLGQVSTLLVVLPICRTPTVCGALC